MRRSPLLPRSSNVALQLCRSATLPLCFSAALPLCRSATEKSSSQVEGVEQTRDTNKLSDKNKQRAREPQRSDDREVVSYAQWRSFMQAGSEQASGNRQTKKLGDQAARQIRMASLGRAAGGRGDLFSSIVLLYRPSAWRRPRPDIKSRGRGWGSQDFSEHGLRAGTDSTAFPEFAEPALENPASSTPRNLIDGRFPPLLRRRCHRNPPSSVGMASK